MLSAISRVRAGGHTLWTKTVPTALNFEETCGKLSHGTFSLLREVQFHFEQVPGPLSGSRQAICLQVQESVIPS